MNNVPLTLAPKHSQEVIAEFGRPEYAGHIARNPIELPLEPDKMVMVSFTLPIGIVHRPPIFW